MRRAVTVAVVLTAFCLIAAPSAADEYVVRLDDADDASSADELKAHADETQEPVVEAVEREGGEVVRRFWITNALLVRGDEARDILAERDDLRVHDNYVFDSPAQTDAVPDAYEVKAGVEQINATGVWEAFGTQGENTSVAVLDTGIDADHPDIDLYTTDAADPTYPGGWAEFDASGERLDSEPYDAGKHGTHVSSSVVGANASGEWIGVAPEADLLHAKVFNASGTFAQINAGIEWAVENEVDVMSLSFGIQCTDAPTYIRAMLQPVRNADDAGTFVVASSGNDGEGCSSSPGNIQEALSVGAVSPDGEVPRFSSGERVNTSEAWGAPAPDGWEDEYLVPDVTAPGVRILGAVPGAGYERMDGTSMATPHVSGVAALAESSTERDMTPNEHRTALRETATVPNNGEPDHRYGEGIVDAYKMVNVSQDRTQLFNTTPVNETDDAVNETGDDTAEEMPDFTALAALVAVGIALVARKRP